MLVEEMVTKIFMIGIIYRLSNKVAQRQSSEGTRFGCPYLQCKAYQRELLAYSTNNHTYRHQQSKLCTPFNPFSTF